eukprot:RCo012574
MFGVLYMRKALVLWQRCYVQLDEAEGVLRVASSPTSRNVERVPLAEVELRQLLPHRFSLVPTRGGARAVHLRTDTTQQREEWAAAITSAQKGFTPTAATAPSSPRRVRFTATVVLISRSRHDCSRGKARGTPNAHAGSSLGVASTYKGKLVFLAATTPELEQRLLAVLTAGGCCSAALPGASS